MIKKKCSISLVLKRFLLTLHRRYIPFNLTWMQTNNTNVKKKKKKSIEIHINQNIQINEVLRTCSSVDISNVALQKRISNSITLADRGSIYKWQKATIFQCMTVWSVLQLFLLTNSDSCDLKKKKIQLCPLLFSSGDTFQKSANVNMLTRLKENTDAARPGVSASSVSRWSASFLISPAMWRPRAPPF